MRPTRNVPNLPAATHVRVGAVLLLSLALAFGWVARAGAEEVSDPFSGTSNPSTETATATATSASTSTSSESIPSSIFIGGGVAVVLLIGGIAYFIMRDARGIAPVADDMLGGNSREAAIRLRKRRAKAKAAKRQRKRHRR